MISTIQQLPSVMPEDTVNLAERLGFLVDNKRLIAGVTSLALAGGLLYLVAARPVYESNILIQVEDRTGAPKSILGDVASIYDTKAGAASEMEILRSRFVVSRAVDNARMHISVEPKYFPVFGEWVARNRGSFGSLASGELSEPGIFGFGGYVWGAEKADVSRFDVPANLEGVTFALTAEGKNVYRLTQKEHGIDAQGVGGSPLIVKTAGGVIELAVDRLHADAGAQFLLERKSRSVAIDTLQRALKISEQGKQSGIIGVTLEGADPQATSIALNEIGRQYIRQNEDRKAEEAEKSLAFLNLQMPGLRQELERSESKYNELRSSQGTIDLGEEAKGILQRAASNQTKMQELRQKRDELLTRYEEEHPTVIAVNQQIRDLSHEMASIEAKIRRLPAVEQNVSRLNRDVKVNTELYTSLMAATQQLRLATANKMGSARLLDSAVTAAKPVKPKPIIVLLLAALVGVVMGVLAAFVRKMLHGTVHDPKEVEMLGLPVSATIPHSATQKRRSLAAPSTSTSREIALLPQQVPSDSAVEGLRRFRTSLQAALHDARNHVVMITGPSPGVGKSFVSANLAMVMASIGKKVLLVDGDLRTGQLHRQFNLERKGGLSEAICERARAEQVIHRNVAPNVDFVSTGALSPQPAELLANPGLGRVLDAYQSMYDMVLIDTAPVLAVSDALTIAEHAGVIFHIVRGGVSTLSEIEESVKRINQAGYAVTGVVVNDLKARYAQYGYGSRYEKYVSAA